MLLVGAIAIIFIGGWVSGTSPLWDRLPGPYLPSADQRSITPEGVAAAEWAGSYLGSGQRVIGDQYTRLLMATYGNERIVTTSQDQVIVSPVFTSPQFDSDVVAILRHGRIQYIVVDRRLSTGLPRIGWYFDGNEPGYTRPVDPAWLAKFDGVQNLSRIFDSGDIIVYDVEAFTSKASITPPPKSLCAQTAVPGSYPQIARAYTGTILDIPAGITILISITGVQQQHETICGYFSVKFENALPNGTPANGTIKGTVAADKHIWFTLTNDRGKATFSFDGLIQPDGTIGGTYCNVGVVTGQCSDYGLWSTSPTQPG